MKDSEQINQINQMNQTNQTNPNDTTNHPSGGAAGESADAAVRGAGESAIWGVEKSAASEAGKSHADDAVESMSFLSHGGADDTAGDEAGNPPSHKTGNPANHTIILILTTIFAKVLGFGRELTLASVYGASAMSDAYVVAFSIPTILFAGVGSAILTSYISVYTHLRRRQPQALAQFNNDATSLVFLLSAAMLVLFWVLDRPIVRLFAVGFQGETLELAVVLSRLMMLSILFIGVYYILQGYLQICGSFFAVGMISVPLNLFVILSIVFSRHTHYTWLGWGVVLGYAASWLMLHLAARRKGYTYRPSFAFGSPPVRQLVMMVFPIFLGKTITQLNTMIDRTVASTLPEGSVSALSYGNRIIGFVTAVFVVSVATALFPHLSNLSAIRNLDKLKSTFVTSAGILSYIVLPISAGAILFAREIVALLFLRGAFTPYDVERTAQVVIFYAIGLLAFSIKDVMLGVFYALQDTVTPTVNSIVALLLNTLLNLVLVRVMAHSGLALATSISGIVTLGMLLICLRRKIGPLGLRRFFVSLGKMLLATAGMAAVAWGAYQGLFSWSGSLPLSLVGAVGAGAAVYLLLGLLLRIEELGLLVAGAAQRLSALRS